MIINQLHPALPVAYTEPSQLTGLEDGDYFCQPAWCGERVLVGPDGTLWDPRGPRRHGRRLADRYRPLWDVGLTLDATLVPRAGLRLNDIVVARPLAERLGLARRYALETHQRRVRSVEEINALLAEWTFFQDCDGVLLKRGSVPYPWLPRGCRRLSTWLYATQPLLERKAE